jgi:hypothetical protein
MLMNSPRSVVVYRTGAVGDLIVLFRVLEALRKAWPQAVITLVAPSEVGQLALVSGWADRLASPDSPWLSRWMSGDPRAMGDALAGTDVFLAYTNDPDGRLGQSAREVLGGCVVVHPPFPPEAAAIHVSDHVVSALDGLGIEVRTLAPTIRPSRAMISAAGDVLAAAHVRPDGRFAVVHAGSSARWKNWPGMPDLAKHLGERYELPVVLQRGPVEAERGMGSGWPEDAPVGTRTVTVFGRRPDGGTHTALWSPRGRRAVAVGPEEGRPWPDVQAVLRATSDLLAL